MWISRKCCGVMWQYLTVVRKVSGFSWCMFYCVFWLCYKTSSFSSPLSFFTTLFCLCWLYIMVQVSSFPCHFTLFDTTPNDAHTTHAIFKLPLQVYFLCHIHPVKYCVAFGIPFKIHSVQPSTRRILISNCFLWCRIHLLKLFIWIPFKICASEHRKEIQTPVPAPVADL